MAQEGKGTDKRVLNAQQAHWETTLSRGPDMFGKEASLPARKAAALFKQEGKNKILELGGGQGRDTISFAQNGFEVHVLDYADSAVDAITQKAESLGVERSVTALRHDVRNRLPFDDDYFDACYSHMLFCMALTTSELEFLSSEVRRVLKPGGLCVYTVRNTKDPHYRKGTHRSEDMYEVGGFIVHFFSEEKVRHLARGYDIVGIDEFEESELPKKLFQVTLRKAIGSSSRNHDARQTTSSLGQNTGAIPKGEGNVLSKYGEFFSEVYQDGGAFDRKTKHLIALAASLAAACEP